MDTTTDFMFNASIDPASIVDSRGQVVTLPAGSFTWASSDETVLSATPSADGMSAAINTVAPGTARIVVTGDGDPGADVAPITATSEDVNLTQGTSGNAIAFNLAFDTPVLKT